MPDSSPGEIRPALERAINQPGAYLTNRAWTTIKDNDVPILEITGQDRPGKDGEIITFTVRATNGALLNPLSFDWTVEDTNGVIDDGMKQIDCERTFIVVKEYDAMGNPIRWVTDPNDPGIDDTVMANALQFTNESCVGGKVSVTKHRGKSGYFYMDAGETERDITFLVSRNGANGYAQFIPEEKAEYTTPEGMETACIPINNGSCPATQNGEGMGASEPAIVVPTTAVANVQVTAVDAVSASVSWDAVPHAASYEVSWDGSGSQTASTGILPSVTGTTATIQHDAQEAMTITVTVTPEYVDGNGQTQLASDLAGTAALDVAQGGTQEQDDQDEQPAPVATPAPHCVSDSLLNLVRNYYSANQNRAPNYGENWKRVLIAFGDVQDDQLAPYTAEEAAQGEKIWSGWKPVREALECIETATAQPTPTPTPPATPEISIASDGDVTEGAAAAFSITANPVPAAPLSVSVSVSQSGDYGVSTGVQTVTIPTSGVYTLTVATNDDSADEADGSVTATVNTGTGYTVSATASAATVAVADNDVPEISIASDGDVTEGSDASFTISASPTPHAALSVSVTVSQSGDYGATTGVQTVSIPTSGSYTLTVATSDDSADEADGSVTATVNTGTGYTVSATAGTATVAVSDDDDPPAQPTEQTCTLPDDAITVAEVTGWRDEYSAATHQSRWNRVLEALGEDTGSGESSMTAAQARDIKSRIDNSRWGRTVRTLEALEQCDEPTPTPEISIASDGDINEGSNASFTITSSPTPSAALSVSVTVSQSGDYGATTGVQTVSIPTSGSYTLSVATSDDSADEADGSVTATLNTGTGYTVSASGGAATVAVSDNDVPEISIAAGSGVTEGSAASFTITASPTPHAALSVSVTVSQSGDYGATTGVQTVSIPTSGSYTLTVATSDDSADEADGSVTATLNTGTGYTVSATASAATVAVSDDDDPPATCTLPDDAITVAEVTGWRDALDADKAAAGIKRWNRVLATLGEDTGHTPMTAEQAREVADWLGNTRWDRHGPNPGGYGAV